MDTQPRRPAGAPTGGQYTTRAHDEPTVTLHAGFPAHGTETRPWESSTGRRPEIDHYEASIPPLIANLPIDLDPQTADACRSAAIDIAVLDHDEAAHLAAIEPFLLRTEAIASSRIEEEHTTVDQLARAEAGIKAPKTARTVKAAIDGLRLMVEQSEDGITLETILAAHRPMFVGDSYEGQYAGRVRDVQNWIGGSDRSPLGAAHVPPHPDRVGALMDDLVTFTNRTDLDPVAQAAIAHAQFESIHPFTDGNGRVGRALINGIWRRRGLTTGVAVPIASAMVSDRDHYFDLVSAYRTGDATSFTRYLAGAASTASREAQVSAANILALPDAWQDKVKARAGSAAAELLALLPSHPIVDADDVKRLTGASTTGAYGAINRLVDAGVLRPITQSKRDMTWAAGDVLDEADDLVSRLRLARI